jgi:predicted O-methyltransferase YrrM
MSWGELYGALTGYQAAALLMAAERVGLIAALGGAGGSIGDLAAATGASPRGVEALVGAMASLGLAEEGDGGWRLSAAGLPLTVDGPDGLDRLIRKEAVFYALWGRLDAAVLSGEALLAPFAERARTDPAGAEAFLLALNDLAGRVAPHLVPAGRLDDARTLADVGGGGGAYALAFARAHPDLTVTIVEQPSVVPISERAVRSAGAGAERIRVVAGDATLPGVGVDQRFDAALVSHVLHDLDREAARAVVLGSASALRPGGILLVHDVFREKGAGDPVVALFDVMMFVENPGGMTHAIADVRAWIAEAGLDSVEEQDLGFSTLVRARARP